MKKSVFLIAFALLLCLSLPVGVFAEGVPNLNDDANLLTDAQEARLQQRMDEIANTYKVEIVIVTVMNIGNASPSRFASSYYDDNQFGYGAGRDGVLLLVSMRDRDYYILSNGLGAAAISNADIQDIGDAIVSPLGNADYADAFDIFLDKCEYQLNGELNGFPFAFGKNILIALAIGFAAGLLATGIMKSKLKSENNLRQPNTPNRAVCKFITPTISFSTARSTVSESKRALRAGRIRRADPVTAAAESSKYHTMGLGQ